jgi:N-acetyl-anhydromuramyl-L-alanine amidase AmpD
MSVSIYQPLQRDYAFHQSLLDSGCFFDSYFEGLPVFRNRPTIEVGNINSQNFFYTADRLDDSGITRTNFINGVHRPENKKGICLHYTEGYFGDDLAALTGQSLSGQYVSVPFIISRTGYIYQLSDPDRELSWHLGTKLAVGTDTVYHNQIIGIELSNFGNRITETRIPSEFQLKHTITLPGPFRGGSKFERFTDAQYNSLRALIQAICRRYPNIEFKLLPPDIRYSFFGSEVFTGPQGNTTVPHSADDEQNEAYFEGEGINRKTDLLAWRGISSHVNWAGRRRYVTSDTYKWRKLDIGPAFDWDRLIKRPDIRFPLEAGADTFPAKLYANTELRRNGGYFPVGCNNMIHSGVHIFSDSHEAAVNSMADGYVIAFRFFTAAQHQRNSHALSSIGLQHRSNTGFILIRHDIRKPRLMPGRNMMYTNHVLYTLYMDLEILDYDKMRAIPWVQKLIGKEPPIPSDIFNARTFWSNGKVVTFSKPLLPVKAGERIGYTVSLSGENHIHWEVFTQEEGLLQNIMQQGNVRPHELPIATEDGVFSADELKRLFSERSFWFSQIIFKEIRYGSLIDSKAFSDFIKDYYAASDKKYTGRIKLNLPSLMYDSQATVRFEALSAGKQLLSSVTGSRITVFPSECVPQSNFVTNLRASDLAGNRYSIEATLQALAKIDELRITSPSQLQYIPAGLDQESFFAPFVTSTNMLRDYIFSNISPWTESYWEKATAKLKQLGIVDQSYTFRKDDFIEYILFANEHESPVYKNGSIFGEDKFINPVNKLTYIHPVTFMWLYLLNKEIEFIPPATDDF